MKTYSKSGFFNNKRQFLLLSVPVLIILLAVLLNLYNIGTESLWLDEGHSFTISSENMPQLIFSAARDDHLPLYFIFLHYWMLVFGNSEIALRSLSALFGVLSVIVIFLIGRALFNNRVGLIGSFLSAISSFYITYSQEARMYTMVLCLSSLSYLFFIYMLKKDSLIYYVSYLLTSILLIYTHLFGVFIICSQVLFIAITWNSYKNRRAKMFSLCLFLCISIIPAGIMIFPAVDSIINKGFWLPEPTLDSLLNTFDTFSGGRILALIFWAVITLSIAFFLYRCRVFLLVKEPRTFFTNIKHSIRSARSMNILLLLVWLIFPILTLYAISKITTPVYIERYLIGATPAFFILVALALENIKVKYLILASLLTITLVSGYNLRNYYYVADKEQWREAAEFISKNSRQNDTIIYCHNVIYWVFDYYYKGTLPAHGIDRNMDDEQQIAEFVKGASTGKDRIWLIESHVPPISPIRKYLLGNLGENAKAGEWNFIGIRTTLFNLTS